MIEEIMFIQNKNGELEKYDDTYDVVIHCESEKEQERMLNILEYGQWIPISERLPKSDEYILISFLNYSGLMIGRYEVDDEGGAFYEGDSTTPCANYGIFVNAWMPLPEPYREV